MIEVYSEALQLLRAGQDVVIATVFDARGSAPRTAGARMVVRADGSILGTIGGGRLEHDAIQAALASFSSRQSATYTFELTGNDVAGMDMICGGSGEVWLHFLSAANTKDCAVCQATVDVLVRREKAWLITELNSSEKQSEGQFALVGADFSVAGLLDLSSETLKQWTQDTTGLLVHVAITGNQRFLIEDVRPGYTVIVFGAGHVSQQVVPLCENVGFQAIVLDDRAEYACQSRFTRKTEVVVLDSFDNWNGLPIDAGCYIVILTRGHIHDKTVLGLALRTQAGYIGMIGSRRKREKIYQALRDEGFSQQELNQVYSPIGLDIGAETPAELAVSIVGELIKVRAAQEKCSR
jgi:xanthine dehydrogenase accessory factor